MSSQIASEKKEPMDRKDSVSSSPRLESGSCDLHLRPIVRKVDYHIVPLMLVCYFLQFLDKVLVNYANIMGFSETLKFQGDDFSWMATAFFIGFAVAEFPQGYLIQRLPVSKVLGVNVILWGVTICCTAAVQDFPGATAIRTLLGMFEAVITPALIMITSQWYTRNQSTPRTGLWYCGLGIGQTVGGLISFAAQQGHLTSGFESWRIMFLAVGAFNLFIGLLVTFWMPSGIQEARFLTEDEKTSLRESLMRDSGGNGAKVFHIAGLREALLDLQVWLLFVDTVLIVIPSGIITTFSATLIRNFGYSTKQAALLNMPSGAVSVFATILGTFAIQYRFPRWLAICCLMIPTLIGAALMSFFNGSPAHSLTGIYLINFDVAPLALVYALAGANVQGYTKRVTTNAIVAVGFSIANIIAPQTFRAKDAPDYIPAKILVFAVCGSSVVVTIVLRLLYGYRNKGKADETPFEGDTLEGSISPEETDLTDRTNPRFVYVY